MTETLIIAQARGGGGGTKDSHLSLPLAEHFFFTFIQLTKIMSGDVQVGPRLEQSALA